jgi:hypothetical protein
MNALAGEKGTWAKRDVESKIAFTSGWAEFTPQATPVYAEQDIVCSAPAITRAAGVGVASKFRCTGDGSFVPLALVTSATPTWNATHVEAAFHRAATALSLTATYNATEGPIIATFVADGTVYRLALIADGTAGYKYLIKGGVFTNWTLLFRSVLGNTASLYAAMAGYNAAFGADFGRGPLYAIVLSNPLLLDTFSGAFGTPDTYGSPWLHAGTCASAAGVASCTPVAGVELVTNGDFESAEPPGTAWNRGASWTVTGGQAVHDGVSGLNNIIQAVLIVDQWYKSEFTAINGSSLRVIFGGSANSGILRFGAGTYIDTKRADAATFGLRTSSAASVSILSVKPLPISTLIANQQLATTDVLAEAGLSAYTLGTQMGFCQSDRPFAFPANANAAAGQNVIVLKNLTNAVPDTDSITIKHPITPTTYTIASVSALVGGVQALTLDSNLVEAVAANDMVGVNWTSWNGAIRYFDGAGNIKVDEVKAGVYTNRSSVATAFSADKRFIWRKIGTEYRGFYNEVLQAAISTIDAASMVGTYWGLFSTDASNTFNSTVIYDTGNVTNSHSILDKYSRD